MTLRMSPWSLIWLDNPEAWSNVGVDYLDPIFCKAEWGGGDTNPCPNTANVKVRVLLLTCMYVCIRRGRPSWNCPWEGAIQLGQGEGPIGIVGPISQPRGTNGTASLTLERTSAPLCTF